MATCINHSIQQIRMGSFDWHSMAFCCSLGNMEVMSLWMANLFWDLRMEEQFIPVLSFVLTFDIRFGTRCLAVIKYLHIQDGLPSCLSIEAGLYMWRKGREICSSCLS